MPVDFEGDSGATSVAATSGWSSFVALAANSSREGNLSVAFNVEGVGFATLAMDLGLIFGAAETSLLVTSSFSSVVPVLSSLFFLSHQLQLELTLVQQLH